MLPSVLTLSLFSALFCFAPNESESEAKVGGHWVFSKKHYKVATQRDGQKEGKISAKENGWPLPVEDEPKWIGKEP